MDRWYLLLLLWPTIVKGQISITIEASDSASISAVHLHGSTWDVISDTERTSFGITDVPLKNAVERHSGGRPQDAFVRSPTPWNDLYTTFGWPEVTRTLRPVRSRISGIESRPVLVASDEYINTSNITSVYSAAAFQDVQNTVSSTWQRSHQLTVGLWTAYEVKMKFGNTTGGGSMSYSSSWGQSSTQSQTVRLGSSSGVDVNLKPGEGVHVALSATHGTMNVEVDYEATLSGAVACNYPRKYNGHHFWGYNVNSVMRAVNLPTVFTSRETLRIGFYSTARLVMTDLVTRKVLVDVPVDITHMDSDYIQ